MAFVIVLAVVLLLAGAYWIDRADRRRGSNIAPSGLIGRRFRDAHRLARDRESFRGNVPGLDRTKREDR